jgi:hypothetical protein
MHRLLKDNDNSYNEQFTGEKKIVMLVGVWN